MNIFKNRKENLNFAANLIKDVPGYILEFGVHKAVSTKQISLILNNNRIIYGFDSFEGLPEDWYFGNTHHEAGKKFHLNGNLPQVPDNIKLIKGWFNDTLPKWVADHEVGPIALLHIDSDLYSSAWTVLELLNDYIYSDTIIVFDEFEDYSVNQKFYHNWRDGEYKAFEEWKEKFNRDAKLLAHSEQCQATFKVIK